MILYDIMTYKLHMIYTYIHIHDIYTYICNIPVDVAAGYLPHDPGRRSVPGTRVLRCRSSPSKLSPEIIGIYNDIYIYLYIHIYIYWDIT